MLDSTSGLKCVQSSFFVLILCIRFVGAAVVLWCFITRKCNDVTLFSGVLFALTLHSGCFLEVHVFAGG